MGHVKKDNKGYHYFTGLSDGEISSCKKGAITGHRPTWTVGVNQSAKHAPLHSTLRSGSAGAQNRVKDPFGFVGQGRSSGPRFQTQGRKLKSLEAKAFDTMGLAGNATSAEIKSRYKELVQKHKPDATGGDRGDRKQDVLGQEGDVRIR